jgi:CheY-like chemotaxis protein
MNPLDQEVSARGVLVVDDDGDLCEAVAELLEDEGYHVLWAQSGQAAIELLAGGYRPTAMLVDYGMPGMNGLEFLRTCRNTCQVVDVPAVLMSGFKPDELSVEGLAFFLRKPFQLKELVTLVATMLARA